jgi:DNA-binding beta-propeller fold protein YncE
VNEGRKPQVDLKAACAVAGRPGAMHLSPDGSRLYLFDAGTSKVTVVGVSGWTVHKTFDLEVPSAAEPFFLGGFEESLFVGGLMGKVAVIDGATRRYAGAVSSVGDACEMKFIRDSRQAVLTTATGSAGAIEFVSLSPLATLGRLELPMAPVRGTLTLLPWRGLGAVVVRDVERRDEAVVLFELGAGTEPCMIHMEGGVRSLAFDAEGRFLFAACHDDSALAVIDVRDERTIEKVLLAGEPYELISDPLGRRIWTLCERLGHVALVDPSNLMVSRRTQLSGLVAGPHRMSFSPEGRLAIVPETGEGCLALIEAGNSDGSEGDLVDRLELGREVGEVLWSPLGDEVYVASPECGSVLKIGVDRGDEILKDTDLYLIEQLIRDGRTPSGVKYPLFPP